MKRKRPNGRRHSEFSTFWILNSVIQLLGDPSEEDPPVPIPNTEVKLLSPDGTAQATVWESRKSPGSFRTTKALRNSRRAFRFGSSVSGFFSVFLFTFSSRRRFAQLYKPVL